VFDFVQRVTESGELSLVESLSCLNELMRSIADGDMKILYPRFWALVDSMVMKITEEPAATLAYEFKEKSAHAGMKIIFVEVAIKIMAALEKIKSIDTLKVRIKLMQAYARVIEKMTNGVQDRRTEEDKKLLDSIRVNLDGESLSTNEALAQIFSDSAAALRDLGSSDADEASKDKDALNYVCAMDIDWFAPEEKPRKLTEIITLAYVLSQKTTLSISDCLKIMPDEGELFKKFKSTPEYANVKERKTDEAIEVTQTRGLWVKLVDNLKQRLASRLEEFGQKLYLDTQDVDELVALFEKPLNALGEVFGRETIKTLREQLVELLFKVQECDYSKLTSLMGAVAIPGVSSSDRKYQLDQLVQLTEKVIHSNTMGFYEGSELLIKLDEKMKEYSGAYLEEMPIPVVSSLMDQHFARQDFGKLPDSLIDLVKDQSCYGTKIYFAEGRNNHNIAIKNKYDAKEKIDLTIKIYIPETDSKGVPHPPGRRTARRMADDEALVLEEAGWLYSFDNLTEEEKNQSFRLFAEGVLPPEKFMDNVHEWSSELIQPKDLPRLNALVNAADDLEQTHAADIEGGQISSALVFKMTQSLVHIAKQQPDDVPGRDSKAKVIAQIHTIEDRHIARLGGEKRDRVAEVQYRAEQASIDD
jgi:hypothetical protein